METNIAGYILGLIKLYNLYKNYMIHSLTQSTFSADFRILRCGNVAVVYIPLVPPTTLTPIEPLCSA